MSSTTYIARHPKTGAVIDLRTAGPSSTMRYTHALVVMASEPFVASWHQSPEAAAKASTASKANGRKVVVEVEGREGGKAKIERQLKAEAAPEPTKAPAKPSAKAPAKGKGSAKAKASTKPARETKTALMLAAIGKSRKGLTVPELVEVTGQTRDTVQMRCYTLTKKGTLVVVPDSRPKAYKLASKAAAK